MGDGDCTQHRGGSRIQVTAIQAEPVERYECWRGERGKGGWIDGSIMRVEVIYLWCGWMVMRGWSYGDCAQNTSTLHTRGDYRFSDQHSTAHSIVCYRVPVK